MTFPKSEPVGGLSSLFGSHSPPSGGLGSLLGSAREHHVLEISKPGGSHNPRTRIQALHGIDEYGKRWTYNADDILGMLAQKHQTSNFYVQVNGRRAKVIPSGAQLGEYLKTEADGFGPNNLLSLPNRLG